MVLHALPVIVYEELLISVFKSSANLELLHSGIHVTVTFLSKCKVFDVYWLHSHAAFLCIFATCSVT